MSKKKIDRTEILDRPIAYHRAFVTLTGSVTAAVMLSQAWYWTPRATRPDGWFYKTAKQWEEETGLTRHEQETARRKCGKYLKSELRDCPAKLFYKLDCEAVLKDLGFGEGSSGDPPPGKMHPEKNAPVENRKASLPESGKPAARKVASINTRDYTETTTERGGGGAKKSKGFIDPEFEKYD